MSTYKEIENSIDRLFESINTDSENIEWINDLNMTLDIFSKKQKMKEFNGLFAPVYKKLEKVLKSEDKKKLDRVKIILRNLTELEPNNIIDSLKNSGRELYKNESFSSSIQGQMYKLLEQVRLGKRDNVIGILMRTFFISQKKFPEELIEAIKPMYADGMFKAFMYSFLGSFTEEKKEDNKENKNKGEKE